MQKSILVLLFLVFGTFCFAQRSGGGSRGGFTGGSRSFSAGSRSFSGGARSFSGASRSFSGAGRYTGGRFIGSYGDRYRGGYRSYGYGRGYGYGLGFSVWPGYYGYGYDFAGWDTYYDPYYADPYYYGSYYGPPAPVVAFGYRAPVRYVPMRYLNDGHWHRFGR